MAYSNGYEYRKQILIPSNNVSGTTDLSNYPFLFRHTDADFKDLANGGRIHFNTEFDFRFELADGTKLDHSVERWNNITGEFIAWVRLPTLYANTDTKLFVYYGKDISTPEDNETGVWSSAYKGVWHLWQDAGGSAPQFLDSTTNANHGTGTSLSSGNTIEGKIGRAVVLDGSADYITIPNASSLQITGDLTVSFWFASSVPPNGFQKANRENIVHKAYGAEWGNTYERDGGMSFYHGNSGIEAGTPANQYQGFTSDSRVRDNLWHHVQMVRDTAAGYNYTYIDGAFAGSQAITVSRVTSTYPVYIGKGYTSNFAGAVDEVRILNTPRSEDWVRTEFRNQNVPSSFFSVGLAETVFNNGYQYRRKASIDYTKVSSTLTDFFFLFSITNADFKSVANGGKVQYSSSLADIRFETAAGKKLSHEIDTYDPATGAVNIWVKIPSVSSTVNTDLYVYYGKSLIASEENAYGVWNARSLVLNYHMNGIPDADITTGDQPDSSVSRQNGSGRGSMTSADRVAGKIGYAVDLDGNDVVDVTQWTGENSNAKFKANRSMTLSAWIRPSSVATAAQSIFEGGTAVSAEKTFGFRVDNFSGTKLNLVKYGVADQRVAATGITANTWTHIAAVQGSTSVTYYVNGASVGSFSNSADYRSNNANLDIGGSSDLNSGNSYFTGQLDEVRMYQSQVPAAYIAAEYNNQNSPSTFFSLGVLEVVNVLAITGNARIQRTEATTIAGNARLQRTESTSITANARIRRTETTSIQGNARIRRTESTSIQGNARIARIESTSIIGNAAIESYFFTASTDIVGNARIQKSLTTAITGNARISRQENTSIVGSAHIERVESTSIQGNATLYRIDKLDIVGNATIEKDKTTSIIGNATIIRQDSLQITANARIQRSELITILGNAAIVRIDRLEIIGNARIERISSTTIVGNAKISNPSPDKRPQQWEDSSTEQPAEWQSEDRAEQVWDQTADKAETQWQDSQETQEQQWSDSDNKQPTEWRRQFYD